MIQNKGAAFFGGVAAEMPLFLDVADPERGFAQGFGFVRADEADLKLCHEMTGGSFGMPQNDQGQIRDRGEIGNARRKAEARQFRTIIVIIEGA